GVISPILSLGPLVHAIPNDPLQGLGVSLSLVFVVVVENDVQVFEAGGDFGQVAGDGLELGIAVVVIEAIGSRLRGLLIPGAGVAAMQSQDAQPGIGDRPNRRDGG